MDKDRAIDLYKNYFTGTEIANVLKVTPQRIHAVLVESLTEPVRKEIIDDRWLKNEFNKIHKRLPDVDLKKIIYFFNITK